MHDECALIMNAKAEKRLKLCINPTKDINKSRSAENQERLCHSEQQH